MKILILLLVLFLFSCQEGPTENSNVLGSQSVDATTEASSMEFYTPSQSYESTDVEMAVVDSIGTK